MAEPREFPILSPERPRRHRWEQQERIEDMNVKYITSSLLVVDYK